MYYELNLYYSWWYIVIFFIFNYGLNILFQHNFRIRFNKVPYIKFYSELNQIFFYLLLVFSIFIKLKSILFIIIGSGIYLVGLSIYISAMY